MISSACSQICTEKGMDLTVLNRGKTSRPLPESVRTIKADINDLHQVNTLLRNLTFDVVVDWIAYIPAHIQRDFELFRNRTAQYVFISSASAYQKPPQKLPIRETEPLYNPFWTYSQQKIACEKILLDLYDKYQFPTTIVRPSHTYDKTKIPLHGKYTTLDRMLRGKSVIIHGDGTSLWTLTHHKDFAKGFLCLLGRPDAIGEAFHITSEEILTWNQICSILADAAGVEPKIIHIPSDFIWRLDEEWGHELFGDKAHSMIFDNSKIKKINPEFEATIPFAEGAKEIVSWYFEKDSRQVVDKKIDQKLDAIISAYEVCYRNN